MGFYRVHKEATRLSGFPSEQRYGSVLDGNLTVFFRTAIWLFMKPDIVCFLLTELAHMAGNNNHVLYEEAQMLLQADKPAWCVGSYASRRTEQQWLSKCPSYMSGRI